MDTLKVSVSCVVASLNESLKTSLHKCAYTAAENCLLTEQVCLGLCSECCFKNACSCAADTECICKSDIVSVACCVLLNSDKARNALASLVLASYCMTRSLRSDHNDVYVLRRNDAAEVDIEAVSEHKCLALCEIRLDALFIKSSLLLIRDKYHNDVSSLSSFLCGHYLQTLLNSLIPAL